MQSILTVSQLNRKIKYVLEDSLPMVEVTGEVSNLARPKSGHLYFTLKDESAQVRCVYFRNYQPPSGASLKDGQQINIRANVSLYEARGEYQLTVVHVSDAGQGALLLQFQRLKEKLQQEGLLASHIKKAIPVFPHRIAIVTSPSGAALQDILSTLSKRFPLADILLYPSEVQGHLAQASLKHALQLASQTPNIDVLILARGGGSIEDLQAFNDENLARMIRQCSFPVVTGIGHETDFTIADFVADKRAATPTAAAQAVSPDIREIAQHLYKDQQRLEKALSHIIQRKMAHLEHCRNQLREPYPLIQASWQRLDRCQLAIARQLKDVVQQHQHHLDLLSQKLGYQNPLKKLQALQQRTDTILRSLFQHMQNTLQHLRQSFQMSASTLHAISPLATLDRGYSITTFQQKVLYSASTVQIHDTINVRLKEGALLCEVTKKIEMEKQHG
ncbi:MAG: exodeoxyribonuclease VII large subunit [Legionellaceae bacterium]|nr:exodeoxyribonuclease VII large subunit [Legionellaceae bacterium]